MPAKFIYCDGPEKKLAVHYEESDILHLDGVFTKHELITVLLHSCPGADFNAIYEALKLKKLEFGLW